MIKKQFAKALYNKTNADKEENVTETGEPKELKPPNAWEDNDIDRQRKKELRVLKKVQH